MSAVPFRSWFGREVCAERHNAASSPRLPADSLYSRLDPGPLTETLPEPTATEVPTTVIFKDPGQRDVFSESESHLIEQVDGYKRLLVEMYAELLAIQRQVVELDQRHNQRLIEAEERLHSVMMEARHFQADLGDQLQAETARADAAEQRIREMIEESTDRLPISAFLNGRILSRHRSIDAAAQKEVEKTLMLARKFLIKSHEELQLCA